MCVLYNVSSVYRFVNLTDQYESMVPPPHHRHTIQSLPRLIIDPLKLMARKWSAKRSLIPLYGPFTFATYKV